MHNVRGVVQKVPSRNVSVFWGGLVKKMCHGPRPPGNFSAIFEIMTTL